MDIDKFDKQTRDGSIFDWLTVSSAVCTFGSDIYADNYIIFDYARITFHEDFYGKENFFLEHTEYWVKKTIYRHNFF